MLIFSIKWKGKWEDPTIPFRFMFIFHTKKKWTKKKLGIFVGQCWKLVQCNNTCKNVIRQKNEHNQFAFFLEFKSKILKSYSLDSITIRLTAFTLQTLRDCSKKCPLDIYRLMNSSKNIFPSFGSNVYL